MPRSISESGHRSPALRLRGAVAVGALASVALVVPGAGSALAAGEPDPAAASAPGVIVGLTANVDPGAEVKLGQEVTYTLTATNPGPLLEDQVLTADFSGVFDDAYLNGLSKNLGTTEQKDGILKWSGDIPAGSVVTINETVRVKGDVAAGAVLDAAFQPMWQETATHLTNPVAGAITAEMTASVAPGVNVLPGDQLTYTLTARNDGGLGLENQVLTADFSGVFDDAHPVGQLSVNFGHATITNGILTWTGDVPAGAVLKVSDTVEVKDDVAAKATLDAAFQAMWQDEAEHLVNPVAGRLRDGLTATVDGKVLTNDDTVKRGDLVTYAATVTNVGGLALANQNLFPDVSALSGIADVIDGSWSMSDHIGTPLDPDFIDGHLGWTGDLAAGGVRTVTFQARVAADAPAGQALKVSIIGRPDGPHTSNAVAVPEADSAAPVKTGPSAGKVKGAAQASAKVSGAKASGAKAPVTQAAVTKAPVTKASAAQAGNGSRLAKTGAEVMGAVTVAAVLVAAGLALTAAQRRRRQGM